MAILATSLVKALLFLPSPNLSQHAIDPIQYSENDPWLIDLFREVFVNAIFTVCLLVSPELLKLNKIPFPLVFLSFFVNTIGSSFKVDSQGKGSVFAPSIIYALRSVSKWEEVPIGQSAHMLGPVLGGMVGG